VQSSDSVLCSIAQSYDLALGRIVGSRNIFVI
jgi:hypothetical protein